MDAGSATQIDDSSGLGNHGTLENQAARVTPGKVGTHALALDGTTDYARVPHNASLDITGAITLATWVKPQRQATQEMIKKAHNTSTPPGENGYELTLANTRIPFVRFNQATSGDALRVNAQSLSPIDGLTWMHVALHTTGRPSGSM
jgi:hypothetical protein